MNAGYIKLQIKKLAKEFDLKYDSSWFGYMWISVKNEILTEYVGMCPDQIYQKYGKTAKQRIENIDKFVASKDFETCLKRYGGQVAKKSELKLEERLIKQIKDGKLKRELLKFNKKLKNKFGKTDFLALLTIPRNKKEKDWQMKFCLRHEWIHILLEKNGIYFQKFSKKYWVYDEGINEYMGAFLDGKLNELENLRKREKYSMEKKNWIYAIKFRKLLENKKTPKERKEAILSLTSKLKK